MEAGRVGGLVDREVEGTGCLDRVLRKVGEEECRKDEVERIRE